MRQGDDLYRRSGEHFPYRQGFVVQDIDTTPGYELVTFNRGQCLVHGQAIDGDRPAVMQAMVRETVAQHLRKERVPEGARDQGAVPVFIDKVSNYRVYHEDGTTGLGKIGQWFEAAYRDLAAEPRYRGLIPFAVERLHNGYFSRDKKGRVKDTRGDTQADEGTYALIMREALWIPDCSKGTAVHSTLRPMTKPAVFSQ